jgi:hypothetical protein
MNDEIFDETKEIADLIRDQLPNLTDDKQEIIITAYESLVFFTGMQMESQILREKHNIFRFLFENA